MSRAKSRHHQECRKDSLNKLRERHKSIGELEIKSGIIRPNRIIDHSATDNRIRFTFLKERSYKDSKRIAELKSPKTV